MIKIIINIIFLIFVYSCNGINQKSLNIKPYSDFELICRLPNNVIRGGVADSGWVSNLGYYVFDNSGFTLGVVGHIDNGPYENMDFVAFYDQLIKQISIHRYKDINLNFVIFINPDYPEGDFKSSLITKDMEVKDVTKDFKNFYNNLNRNLKKRYQYDWDLYCRTNFQNTSPILLLSKNKLNSGFFRADKNGNIIEDVKLDKFHFFDFMNSEEYINNPFEYLVFGGELNNWLVVNQGFKNILRLMNYKTGEMKIYDLRKIADYYKVAGVTNYYDGEEISFGSFVTSKNIYIILDGEDETVVLAYKGW